MKFYGTPNLYVTDRKTHKLVCQFNDKGEFSTTDEDLIKRLKPLFKYEDKRSKKVAT